MKLKAFTLIEILVCIAIIAVLAGILFPVISTVRKKGYSATCLSNEKQIGLALKSYALDYDGFYPTYPAWRDGGVFKDRSLHCPLVPVDSESCVSKYPCGYGINVQATDINAREPGAHDSVIRFPSMFIVVAEVNYSRAGGLCPFVYLQDLKFYGDTSYEKHQGGAHYLFADGHVKWLLPGQLSTFVSAEDENGKQPSFVK